MSGNKFTNNKAVYVDFFCRLILAIVFLVAGVPKLLNPVAFAPQVAAYGMLPDFLVFPAAVLLPLFEVAVALALLFNRREGVWGALLLLVIFILVLSYALYLGLDIDCGCFGPEDPESKAFSSIRTALFRDVVLLCFLIFPFCYRGKKERV